MIEKRETWKLRDVLYSLDWSKILKDAIDRRKTSWNENPVKEWRNASDEIGTSVFFALQDKGVLDKSFGYLTEDEIRQNEHDKTLDQVIAEIKERVMLAQLGLEKATSNHDIGFFTGTRETLKYLKSAIEKLKVKT